MICTVLLEPVPKGRPANPAQSEVGHCGTRKKKDCCSPAGSTIRWKVDPSDDGQHVLCVPHTQKGVFVAPV